MHYSPGNGLVRTEDGELLSLAEGIFDVFVTIDQGLEHQQNLIGRSISILVIEAMSNKLEDLLPAVPLILLELPSLGAGQLRRVSAPQP